MAKNKIDEKLELEEIQDLLTETRNTNNRNHDNYTRLDGKISFYFTLTTTILLLFVKFIEYPKTNLLRSLYFLSVLILITTLILLIVAYNPKGYNTIYTDKLISKYLDKGYKTRLDLLKSLTGTISANTTDVKKINLLKANTISLCSWLIFIATILIIVLSIALGVLNG